MRVVFLGNARWSVPSLKAVAGSSHEMVRVVTRVPRPGGRGNRLLPTPVAEAARGLDLPLEEVETVKSGSGFQTLAEAEPDILAVVAYGEIVPASVLALPAVGPVNVHFSLLPKLRGAAPVQRAILAGVDVTGVTTIRMDEGMDTGPILLQESTEIGSDEDAGSLGDRLAEIGGRVLVATLDGLAAGSIEERPQDHEEASFAPKLKPDDRVIDWGRKPVETVRLVRALAPEPGAVTSFRGRRLGVVRASVWQEVDFAARQLGSVIEAGKDGLVVMAGHGALRLEEVQPEGRRRMSGADFVRGYRPELGELLGSVPGEGPGRA
jgi:methionyl-tRNA formyltransferase